MHCLKHIVSEISSFSPYSFFPANTFCGALGFNCLAIKWYPFSINIDISVFNISSPSILLTIERSMEYTALRRGCTLVFSYISFSINPPLYSLSIIIRSTFSLKYVHLHSIAFRQASLTSMNF